MLNNRMIRNAVIICLISSILTGYASAVPPAEGVSWDNYIPDMVDHPAKAELRIQNGIAALSAATSVSGTRPMLVIMVRSLDTAPWPSHTPTYYNNLFFGTEASVADYYSEVSYGAFTYTPAAVLGWYQSSYTTAEIANNLVITKSMIRWAIQQADTGINYASFDTNGDGVVTNEELTIYVVMTGTGGELGGTAVWAHHWWAGSVVCDGKIIEGEYSVTSEVNPIGSFAHELGHDLGLPDLYDTDGGSAGIGHYGLMGSGSWCGPSHMTAWEKIQLGWLIPTVVTTNGFYDIRDVETHAEAYVLRSPSHTADEYFLIENRQRGTSYDAAIGLEGDLDDEGIIIYHIDEAKAADWFSSGVNNVNADEAHKGVDVECADAPTSHTLNADDLDRNANRGDSHDLWDITEYDFTDTSSPAAAIWYDGGDSGISVSLLPASGSTMRTYLAISPRVIPFPGYTYPPLDPDQDGLYEDVNGDGVFSFGDIRTFFEYYDVWIPANEPVECFDYDGNGFIGFGDVRALFWIWGT